MTAGPGSEAGIATALAGWLGLGLGLGLALLLAAAWRQNRPLWRALREHDSLTLRTLLDTLRIWAPLGLVVLGLWLGARAAGHYGVSLLYRHTTLDEFCSAGPAHAPIVLPCTGFDGVLPSGALRPAGVQIDASRHLFERYRVARESMWSLPPERLHARARDRDSFARAFAPATVLGLTPRPPLDPLLLSMFRRRQQLLADPLHRAQIFIDDLVPQLGITPGTPELASLDARIRQRLRQLHEREFGHLSAGERKEAYARNRIAIPLLRLQVPVHASLLDGQTRSPDETARAIARSFADSQAAAWSVLAPRIGTPAAASAAYQLLAMPRLCTVAAAGEEAAGENGGLFACGELAAVRAPIALRSLGFRESARRSLDRLRTQAHFDAHAQLDAGPRIDALHREAREKLERYFTWLDLLAILGYLVLALVVIKSLLYVLALELFHTDSRLAISFDTDVAAGAEGAIEHGPTVVIDKAFPFALITRKQMGNSNSSLQWLAWPWSAPIHRLLRGRYALFNRGSFLAEGSSAAPGMVASAESPLSVVLWRMQPGEEVLFSYKDFYGASENITLEKETSLRLSTLLLGRWIWHYARCQHGEGILLLKARVQAVDPQLVSAVPRARLVAWNRHMRFQADSQRHPWRSLFNDFTLVRSREPGRPAGKWITAPEQAEAGPFGRLLAFCRSVFSALF